MKKRYFYESHLQICIPSILLISFACLCVMLTFPLWLQTCLLLTSLIRHSLIPPCPVSVFDASLYTIHLPNCPFPNSQKKKWTKIKNSNSPRWRISSKSLALQQRQATDLNLNFIMIMYSCILYTDTLNFFYSMLFNFLIFHRFSVLCRNTATQLSSDSW